MKIPIVNEQDEVISYKERGETTREDIRRIASLFVFDQNLNVLIAKRQSTKIIDPNLWGPTVVGTVDEGFDYNGTVIKEAEEEIGLFNIQPIFLKKIFYETDNARRFSSIYHVVINSEETKLIIQEEEVSEIKWLSLLDLEHWWSLRPEEFTLAFNLSLDNMKEIYNILIK